ncbi:uncharacterized protein [Triticum aestivum]|uniref:uncharacterized protein n=1 Tax=Triticum aestivum TaxID=4565 RepID=UPI001D0292E6|nr:uncharacterized protein LOC123067560 [Triticum aestivum]
METTKSDSNTQEKRRAYVICIEGALGAVELRILCTELRLQLARRDLVLLEQMPLLLGMRGEGSVACGRGVPGRACGTLEEPPLGVGQPGELPDHGGIRRLNGLCVIGELHELQLRVGRLDGRDAREQIGEEGVCGGNRRGGPQRGLLLLRPGGLLLCGVLEEGIKGIRRQGRRWCLPLAAATSSLGQRRR